jgi:hypothetical protein
MNNILFTKEKFWIMSTIILLSIAVLLGVSYSRAENQLKEQLLISNKYKEELEKFSKKENDLDLCIQQADIKMSEDIQYWANWSDKNCGNSNDCLSGVLGSIEKAKKEAKEQKEFCISRYK